MMKYYLIDCNADGEVYINEYTDDQLLDRLNDEPEEYEFSDKIPKDNDAHQWNKQIIIQGNIIVPEAIEVVKEFRL